MTQWFMINAYQRLQLYPPLNAYLTSISTPIMPSLESIYPERHLLSDPPQFIIVIIRAFYHSGLRL